MSIAKETATVATITAFVNERLVAEDEPVDATAPLLELGLLDSLGLGSLLAFIQEHFGVIVPDERVVPSCFMDIEHVASLIDELRQSGGGPNNGDGIGSVPQARADTGVVGTRTLSLPSGAEIHALEVTGRGAQWLLLPGLGEVAISWSTMLQGLAGEHRALAIDYAGFGLSTCPQPEPTLSDHVAHALELLQEISPAGPTAPEGQQSPVVLVGCSAGSVIACELARRLGSRVQALVVTGFGLITDPEAWWSAMQRLADDPRAFLAAAFDRPVTLTTEALEEVLSRPAYRSFLGPEDRARLPTMFEGLNVPVLVVGGQSDGIIPRDAFVRAGEAIGGARLEWLARCGHFPHVECTDELIHLIERFLEEQTP